MCGKKGEKNTAAVGSQGDVNFRKRNLGKKPVLLRHRLESKAELLLVTDKKLESSGSN